jgi:hypothetical protein
MAVFTRINGDAGGVLNSDQGRTFANATIINTGIAAPLTAYKIVFGGQTGTTGNVAAELTTGGAIESVLRWVAGNATVLAYQVDTGNQLSVLVERSGWASDTAIQTAIQTGNGQWTAATGGNIGATGNLSVGTQTTVASTGGIKLA